MKVGREQMKSCHQNVILQYKRPLMLFAVLREWGSIFRSKYLLLLIFIEWNLVELDFTDLHGCKCLFILAKLLPHLFRKMLLILLTKSRTNVL